MSAVLVCAGEPSSDAHAAGVIERVLAKRPGLNVVGVGGQWLKAVCDGPILDNAPLAHTGLTEVIVHLPDAIRLLRGVKKLALAYKPSFALLVDTPDFNMRLLKPLKRIGVPIVYFIAPQAWAWRKGRARTLAKTIDRLFVIFPFEEDFFSQLGVETRYVGHPAPLRLKGLPRKEEILARLGLNGDAPVVALLPGSRYNELRKHWPLFAESFQALKRAFPKIQGVLALAPGIERSRLEAIRPVPYGVVTSKAGSGEVLKAATLALMSSGTVTLEAGLLELPGVIVYRMSGLTYRIARSLVSTEHIGMANILLGERVLPELIQHEASPNRVVGELAKFLGDAERMVQTKAKLSRLKDILGVRDAYGHVAQNLLEAYL
jgi:lipid-A-disaccharide synthase